MYDASEGVSDNYNEQMIFRAIFLLIGVISFVFLIVIFVTIIYNTKLQSHPAGLIATICLNEAALVFYACI